MLSSTFLITQVDGSLFFTAAPSVLLLKLVGEHVPKVLWFIQKSLLFIIVSSSEEVHTQCMGVKGVD